MVLIKIVSNKEPRKYTRACTLSVLAYTGPAHLSARLSPSRKLTVLEEADSDGGSGGRDGKYARTSTSSRQQMAASGDE